ncbi:hypothetical protein Bca52824_029047 [Brassica carinata]|uniref:Peroxidase n=1 Tax=Brassica carinata TaxID=52824 RepID=A0A8X7VDG6_BRACI|nr:hypothetical protein Bca52824_029047 [Brassica carinata]
MGFSRSYSCSAMGVLILGCLLLQASKSDAQPLRPDFYSRTCPGVFGIIWRTIVDELRSDPRIAASILRLHFHDCFVNEVQGGQFHWEGEIAYKLSSIWLIQLFLLHFSLLINLKSFADVGLNRPSDLVALSGGHTFGRAQCQFVTPRLYNFNGTNRPDPSLNPTYRDQLRRLCPQNGNGTVLVNFDPVTPDGFDNQYYTNLRQGKGLIQSDQELFSTPRADTILLVEQYSNDRFVFFQAFTEAMIRMGNLKPLTGTQGEIRVNCRVVNSRIRSVENEDDGVVSSI